MNKCCFFLVKKSVFWLNHHNQALTEGQKLFYWDSDSIVLQNSRKKRGIRVFKYWNWTISTFPSIMTPSHLTLVGFEASSYIMITCRSPLFLTAFLSWGQLWFSITSLSFLTIISFMKKPKTKPTIKTKQKKGVKPSKKRKLRQRRYTCHFWGNLNPPTWVLFIDKISIFIGPHLVQLHCNS